MTSVHVCMSSTELDTNIFSMHTYLPFALNSWNNLCRQALVVQIRGLAVAKLDCLSPASSPVHNIQEWNQSFHLTLEKKANKHISTNVEFLFEEHNKRKAIFRQKFGCGHYFNHYSRWLLLVYWHSL